MRTTTAAAGSAVFLLIVPGTVAGLLPWWLTGWHAGAPYPLPLRAGGAILLAIGALALVRGGCGRRSICPLVRGAHSGPPIRRPIRGLPAGGARLVAAPAALRQQNPPVIHTPGPVPASSRHTARARPTDQPRSASDRMDPGAPPGSAVSGHASRQRSR